MSLGDQKNFPHDADGLETFPSPFGTSVGPNLLDDDYIELVTHEFTCLCPKTGQPDFATISIRYIPNDRCIESKSLKLYFWGFRNQGCFHEKVTKTILDDLVKAMDPKWLQVKGEFGVRGGIYEKVICEHLSIYAEKSFKPHYRFEL